MRPFKQSLTARLAAYFLLLALSLVGTIGWLAYALSRDNLTQSVSKQLEAVWALQQDSLLAWLNEQQHELQVLAASPYIRAQAEQILQQPPTTDRQSVASRQLAQEFAPQLQLRPDFMELSVFDLRTGQNRFSTQPTLIGKNRLPQDFIAQVSAHPEQKQAYLFRTPGSSQLTIAAPLLAPAEASQSPVRAILAVQVSLDNLQKLLTSQRGSAYDSLTSYLLDTDGKSLATVAGQSLTSFASAQALAGQRGQARYTNHAQVPVIGAYGWLSPLKIALLVELPQWDAFAASRQMALKVLLLGIFLALLLTILVWWLAGQLAHPILAIHETALLVTHGELSAKAPVLTTDEVGVLAQSFNMMVSKLREIEFGLRGEIAERIASEDRFAKIFFASPIPMAIERISDHLILEVNDEFLRLSQRTRTELTGKTAEQIGLALNHQLRDQFYETVRTQGSVRDFEINAGLESNQHTLLCSAEKIAFQGAACVLAAFQDITERKRAEARFAKVFHESPIPMALMRLRNQTFVTANAEFLRLTRLQAADVPGKTHPQIGFEVEPELRQHFFSYLLAQDSLRDYELTVNFRGHERVLLISSEKILFNGEACVLGSFQNITERKQAEDRFTKAFHANPVSMTLFSLDDYRILEVNQRTLKLTGLTREEMLGRTIREIGIGVQPESWQQINETLRAVGHLKDTEIIVQYRTGEYTLLACAEMIVFNGERCLLWSQQDITARKQAEERFSKAFHANPLPMSIARLRDGEILEVNDSTLRLMGFSRAELIGQTALKLGFYVDARQREEIHEQLQRHGSVRNFEAQLRFKNGVHTLLLSVETVTLNGEKCALWTQQDITERKRAEENLRESKARLRMALDAGSLGVWEHDLVQQMIYLDDRAQLHYGLPPAVSVETLLARLHPEDSARTRLEFQQALDPAIGSGKHTLDYRVIQPDGSLRWLRIEADIQFTGEGAQRRPMRSTGTSQDITTRKLTEQALRQWADAFEHCAHGLAIAAPNSNQILFGNPALARLYGRSVAELSGLPVLAAYSPSEHPRVQALIQHADRHGHVQYEAALQRKDGTLFPGQIDVVSVFDEQGQPLYRVTTVQDITARKTAEAALRTSEERQRIALEATQLGIWEHDLTNDQLRIDERVQQHFGLTSLSITKHDIAAKIHPEDAARVRQAIRAAHNPQTSDGNYAIEYRVIHPDGTWRWLAVRALIHFAGEGINRRTVRVIGTSLDITERKQAEERFFKAFHANPTPMSIVRARDRVVLEINEAFLKLAGWQREQIVGDRFANHSLEMDEAIREDLYHQIAHVGHVRNRESRVRFNTGQKVTLSSAEAISLNGEACILWTNQDITERKQAEERFIKAFDANPNPMTLLCLPAQTYVQVNQAWLEASGLSPAEVLGRSGTELSRWAQPERREQFYQLLAQNGHVRDFEAEVFDRDEELRTYLLSGDIIQINDQPHLLTSSNDITVRKQTEAAIQASEARFRTLTELSPAAILIFDEQRFGYVNPAAEKLLGYTQAEFAQLQMRDILHPKARLSIRQRMQARLRGEAVSLRNEVSVITKTGEQRWIDYSASTIELEGKPHYIVTGFDVTKRKRAEAAIQASEARFRTLAESSQAAILIFNKKHYLYSNPAANELFGYTTKEFRRLKLRDILHPASYATIEARQHLRQRGAPVSQRNQVQIVTKNGSIRWIDYSVGTTEVDGLIRYVITALDITQRQLMEAALQASEARFRTLAESSQAAILIYDDERFIYANPAAEALFGYRLSELVLRNLGAVLHPDSRLHLPATQLTQQADTPAVVRLELQIICKNGESRWLDNTIALIELDDKPCHIITAFDITERKNAEAALRISEQKFAMTFNASPDPMALTSFKTGQFVMVNDAWLKCWGSSRDAIVGQSFLNLATWADEEQRRYMFDTVRNTGSVHNLEVRACLANNVLSDLLVSAEVVQLGDEKFILSVSKDITSRKRVEAQLQASESRFRILAETSQAAILIENDASYIYANPAAELLFGYPQAELIQLNHFQIIHSDWDAHFKELQARRRSGEFLPHREEVQIVRKDGTVRWVDYSVSELQLENQPHQIVTAFDITERKQVEASLQASEAKFRTLAETSQAAILIADEQRYIYVSPAAEHLFGYTSAEFAELQAWDLIHTDWQSLVHEHHQPEASHNLLPPHGEVKITKKDGSQRWVSYTIGFTQLEGRPCRIITAFDITQRKQAEEERRISQEQLRNLAARLQAVREDERASMAREIHDEFGQALTGMKMDLKGIENQLPPEAHSLRQRFQSLYELINTTVRNVRNLATTLRPGVLDDFGLVAAIEWQAREFEARTGITCHLQEMPEEFPLDKELATAVFRIFQETLTNSARHANATRITVRLFTKNAKLCLEVRDNGRGITSDEIKHTRSLGLIGMRERALLLGGTFTIKGIQGQGTTVTVQIPSTSAATTPGGFV